MPDQHKDVLRRPKRANLSEAYRAWELAEYERCIEILSDDTSADGLVLHAYALLRLERNSDVVAVLRQRTDRFWGENLSLVHALTGAAHLRSGNDSAAHKAFKQASLNLGEARASIAAEVYYYTAQAAWFRRDLDEAESILRQIAPGMDIVYVRALDLLGFIAIARQDFQGASRYFSLALSEYARCIRRDEHLRASVLANVMTLAVELLDRFLADQIHREIGDMTWTSAMNSKRFLYEHYRGKLALLNGDADSAYDAFETAAGVANSAGHRAVAKLDLSDLEMCLNEPFAARRWLAGAFKEVEFLAWSKTDGDERMALLSLAKTSCAIGVDGGSNPLMRYLSAREPKRSLSALNSDPRTQAFEYEARGHVARARGDVDAAKLWFHKSLREWRRLRFGFHSVQVGTELSRLGDDSFHVELREFDRAWPKSIIPSRGSGTTLDTDSDLSNDRDPSLQLGRAERRVYQKLCEGKTAGQIATELARSVHTINNQTRRIFKAFGVRTRAALVADRVRRIQKANVS